MSNAGQGVLTVVGTVVGAYFGYPALGYAIGSLAGQALFPTQLPAQQGPRLGDSQATLSQVGASIAICFGTQVVGGIVIWASPIREEASTTTAGGKGGPEQEQTTYKYYRSFAVLLCEGPIAGVRRVWFNGKKVYDKKPLPGVSFEDAWENVRGYDAIRIQMQQIRSQWLSERMTVYLGTEDQMPDPVIESFEGAGNVPGMRGYAYVVVDDWELKAEDGFRMPAQMKFEVYENGDESTLPMDYYSNEVLYPWNKQEQNPINPFNRNDVISWQGPSAHLDVHDNVNDVMQQVVIPFRGHPVPNVIGLANGSNLSPDLMNVFGGAALADGPFAYVKYNALIPQTIFQLGEEPEACDPFSPWATPGVYWMKYPDTVKYTTDVDGADPVGPSVEIPFDSRDRCTGLYWVLNSSDTTIRVHRFPSAPRDPCEGLTQFPIPGWGVTPDGLIAQCGAWIEEAGSWLVMQTYTGVSSTEVKYPLNPTLPVSHPSNTQAFWEAAYEEHVARGTMEPGLLYGTDYPRGQGFAYRKDFEGEWVEVYPVSIASIVSRLCERVGLYEYDVSDLEDRYVVGYTVGRQMICRAAIEPLRSIGFFDSVESGIFVKFPTRGKASVATISSDELGARFSDEERPSQLLTQKKQEYELPRLIRVHYQNPDRDFDPGEELSPVRFDTKAESPIDIDIAAAVFPDDAAKIAEVLYRDAWVSRWQHQSQMDVSRSALEAADAIIVPVDGRLQRLRIPSVVERGANLRSFEFVRDDDGNYVSTAIGTPSPINLDDEIPIYGPVELLILDLPSIRPPADDDAGFYVGVRPLVYNGDFRGATITRSTDGGNSYVTVASVATMTISGSVVFAPPDQGPTTVFDEENELRVALDSASTLESRSEIDVLNGANACAIGAHGRWEIVQFKNTENIAGDVWSLTGLLRGRRGTEHNIGKTQIGDRFVMLSNNNLVRVIQQVSDIHAEYMYRASALGYPLSVDPIEFAGDGESLKPFSPVHITGERDPVSESWIFEWTRRDRLSNGLDTPMSEDVEDYEVDMLTESGEVIRTISVSAQSATYTSDQQVTDFGSVQSTIRVRIYQISVQVGRGYPGEAIL